MCGVLLLFSEDFQSQIGDGNPSALPVNVDLRCGVSVLCSFELHSTNPVCLSLVESVCFRRQITYLLNWTENGCEKNTVDYKHG